MTGRSFALSMATVAVVFAIAGRCSAPDPAPLPAKVQARVVEHRVQTVIDSTEIRRLKIEQRALQAELDEQLSISVHAEASAMWARLKADSLRAAVDTATTAADSAHAWHAAYDARALEADSLRSANAGLHVSLVTLQREATVADSIAQRWAGHAARSDTLIAALLPLAERHDDRCSVFFDVIKCPTRKQAAIGALLAGGAIGYAVAKKKELDLVIVKIRF